MKKDLSSVKTVDLKAAAGQTLAELFSPAFFQPSPAVQNLHLVPAADTALLMKSRYRLF